MKPKGHAPEVSQEDLYNFHEAHFSASAIELFDTHFYQPTPENQVEGEATIEGQYVEEEEDDGLGYYADGVKRTLTDEQIAIFRHSEIEALRREQEKRKAVAISQTTPPPSTHSKGPSKTKKKNKRRKLEPKTDLRKRTWDVVDAGLDTLDYGEDSAQDSQLGPQQRRRISYDD